MENNIPVESKKSGKKKTLFIIVALLLVVAGGYVGNKAYKKSMEQGQGKKGRGRRGVVAVDAVEPKIMPMRDLRNFTGSLNPWSSYDLAPKVGGRLEKLTVNIGDPVKKGELIAKIDDVEYQQGLAQAKAETETKTLFCTGCTSQFRPLAHCVNCKLSAAAASKSAWTPG